MRAHARMRFSCPAALVAAFAATAATASADSAEPESNDNADLVCNEETGETESVSNEETGNAEYVCDEETGQAESALSTLGVLCQYSCAGAVAAGCATVAAACTAGTVWTFGGVSIPCTYAMVAACYGIGAAGLACAKLCEVH